MGKMHKIHSLAVLGVVALLMTGCSERQPDGIAVSKAWVRLPAVKGEAGAAYFTIEGGAEGTKLTGISSPMTSRIELHESMEQGGMSAMRALTGVEFDYRRRIRFAPGGKHAMLFGINQAVKPGASIPLTFAFDTAPPVTVDAEVRDAAGDR
jgi:copper(I)-binding protein